MAPPRHQIMEALPMADQLGSMKRLSPRRNSTTASNLEELVDEQLAHFGIDPSDDYGKTWGKIKGYDFHCLLTYL